MRDNKYLAVGVLEPKFQRRLVEQFGGVDSDTLKAGFLQNDRDFWDLHDACVGPCL